MKASACGKQGQLKCFHCLLLDFKSQFEAFFCAYLLLIFNCLGSVSSAVWGLAHRSSDLKIPHVTLSLFYCCHTSGFPNSTCQEVFIGRKIRGSAWADCAFTVHFDK